MPRFDFEVSGTIEAPDSRTALHKLNSVLNGIADEHEIESMTEVEKEEVPEN